MHIAHTASTEQSDTLKQSQGSLFQTAPSSWLQVSDQEMDQ
jgi:hypothetical protein